MRWRALVIAVAFALLIVLGAAAAPIRRPITQADSGKTFRIARSATATFRLSNRWQWSTPRSSTKAITLVPVEYFIDPGFHEWQIDARARGSAILRAYGRPNCDGCTLGPRRVRITFVVGAN